MTIMEKQALEKLCGTSWPCMPSSCPNGVDYDQYVTTKRNYTFRSAYVINRKSCKEPWLCLKGSGSKKFTPTKNVLCIINKSILIC